MSFTSDASNGRGKIKSFNLLRWFSALSLVSIIIVSAASAFILSRFLTENMIRRDAVVSMDFVASIVHAENAYGYFLGETDPDPAIEIEGFFDQISRMPDVARANVYSRDRKILWSSDPELIGGKFGLNHELEEAFAGELEIESGQIGADGKEEHVSFGSFGADNTGARFVENYIPIWNPEGRIVIGVVEIYKFPRDLFKAIDEGNWLIWSSALAGALFLYGSLFWIVRRGSLVIQHQQEQLVETETLAAMGAMASAVAHSIRNPLASIRSSADLALDEEPDRLRECAMDIIKEADRLDNWVRDLLTYSRTEKSVIEEVNINEVIRDTLRDLEPAMEKAGVKLRIEAEDDLPTVRGHCAPLGQAFHNLFRNALDGMPKGGELVVASHSLNGSRRIEIKINDTGEGIPKDVLDKVFRPFVTTKRDGLGIGLALTRRIVEQHGGEIALDSTVGQGTTVTVRIPTTE